MSASVAWLYTDGFFNVEQRFQILKLRDSAYIICRGGPLRFILSLDTVIAQRFWGEPVSNGVKNYKRAALPVVKSVFIFGLGFTAYSTGIH